MTDLRSVGPVVELQLAPGTGASSTREVAARAPVLGLIDTGATVTVIQEGLATRLGLNPVGVAHIDTPTSVNFECYRYLVRLVLPNEIVLETIALEAPLARQHVACLLGRDVLAHAVLVYIGYGNLFSLSV